MCGFFEGLPVKAAEKLEVQFEDMSLPIPINDLSDWVEGMSIPNSIRELSEWAQNEGPETELSSWLNLLDLESRAELAKLLKAPLIKDRSMAREILKSWFGRQLLDEVSDLVRLDDDSTGAIVFDTLERLLENQPEVTTIDLLEKLPGKSIYLDLDAFLQVANRWRAELSNQKQLALDLRSLPSSSEKTSDFRELYGVIEESFPQKETLSSAHRAEPLSLDIWKPSLGSSPRSSWIVFMPGWGGAPDHFHWLARNLSQNGWPVILLEHPGSDAAAVRELLKGRRSAPGAEVIPDRLADLYSVLKAKEDGKLNVPGEKLVLMGHSLGALTAFFAAGAIPEPGLDKRCEKALDALSLTNLSQFMQCQMVDVQLPEQELIPSMQAIVGINSFGSLLWPSRGGAKISIPVLLSGGTYDLITPALSEQLGLLQSTKPNKLSRTLLIEGASHFSPIRVKGQVENASGEDLFQLGEAFVGEQPLAVQNLLGMQIIRFLEGFEAGKSTELLLKKKENKLNYYLLNHSNVERILEN